MHVHIIPCDGEAKFWLEPEIELAKNYQYSRKQLREIELLVEGHYNELISAWQQHFGGRNNSYFQQWYLDACASGGIVHVL